MPDFFWIIIAFVVVSNVVKAVRRSTGGGGGSRGRPPARRNARATAWDLPVPPDDVARPQRQPPPGGWPLGRPPDVFTRFATLRAPAGHVGPVTARRGTFRLGGYDVAADLALFTWSWQHRDDGRWEPCELPVAMVRLPADMPELLLHRPGRGVNWAGVVTRPDRFSVDHAWAIETADPRFSSLFTPEFATAMASMPRLVFEARGDLLVVAPAEPRVVPGPGVVTEPPGRLDAAATSTDDELPTLAELVARLLASVPDGWWHEVLDDVDAVGNPDEPIAWPSRDDPPPAPDTTP